MATSKRKDFTQAALDVVRQATGEAAAPVSSKRRNGGLVGGTARATVLTQEQRSEIARAAAQARWKKGA